MARIGWTTNGPGLEVTLDGVRYRVSPVPAGHEPTGRFIAWADDSILGTAASLVEAQALCEREAESQSDERRSA